MVVVMVVMVQSYEADNCRAPAQALYCFNPPTRLPAVNLAAAK